MVQADLLDRALAWVKPGGRLVFCTCSLLPEEGEGQLAAALERHILAAGGSEALEWEGERSKDGQAARDWLRTKANSIEGGTSEIQLNIIAKHLLQLPGA